MFNGKCSKVILIAGLAVTALSQVGCDHPPVTANTDEQIAQKSEQIQKQGLAQVGMPNITRHTELAFVKRIYEKRDAPTFTFAYIPDQNGKLWHLCDSIGYGLPYAVQFSNPTKRVFATVTNQAHNDYDSPQAEPNGLFMPVGAEGTWVDCIDPSNRKKDDLIYVEPRVIVSPWKLQADGKYDPSAQK